MVGLALLVEIVEITNRRQQTQILYNSVIAYIEMSVGPFADRRKHPLDQHIIKSDETGQ